MAKKKTTSTALEQGELDFTEEKPKRTRKPKAKPTTTTTSTAVEERKLKPDLRARVRTAVPEKPKPTPSKRTTPPTSRTAPTTKKAPPTKVSPSRAVPESTKPAPTSRPTPPPSRRRTAPTTRPTPPAKPTPPPSRRRTAPTSRPKPPAKPTPGASRPTPTPSPTSPTATKASSFLKLLRAGRLAPIVGNVLGAADMFLNPMDVGVGSDYTTPIVRDNTIYVPSMSKQKMSLETPLAEYDFSTLKSRGYNVPNDSTTQDMGAYYNNLANQTPAPMPTASTNQAPMPTPTRLTNQASAPAPTVNPTATALTGQAPAPTPNTSSVNPMPTALSQETAPTALTGQAPATAPTPASNVEVQNVVNKIAQLPPAEKAQKLLNEIRYLKEIWSPQNKKWVEGMMNTYLSMLDPQVSAMIKNMSNSEMDSYLAYNFLSPNNPQGSLDMYSNILK